MATLKRILFLASLAGVLSSCASPPNSGLKSTEIIEVHCHISLLQISQNKETRKIIPISYRINPHIQKTTQLFGWQKYIDEKPFRFWISLDPQLENFQDLVIMKLDDANHPSTWSATESSSKTIHNELTVSPNNDVNEKLKTIARCSLH